MLNLHPYNNLIKRKKGCINATFFKELSLTLCGYNTNSV